MAIAREKHHFERLLVAGLLMAGIVLLSLRLGADAPGNISRSAGVQFDPPSKCHNARNHVLFGRWSFDEWNPYVHSPLYTGVQAAVFELLGVGVVQMRGASVVFSAFSLWLCYLIVARERGRRAGIGALLIAVCSYPFVVYGRSALLEPMAMCSMLAAVYFLQLAYRAATVSLFSPSPGRLWMSLAGLATAAAFLSKATATPFVVATGLTLLCLPPRRSRSLWWFFGFLLLPLLVYVGPFLFANLPQFNREGSYWAGRATGNVLALWLKQPTFHALRHMRLPAIAAFLAVLPALTEAVPARQRPVCIASAIMAATLVAWTQFLAFVEYRPSRYYAPVLAPFIVLAAGLAAGSLAWARRPQEPGKRHVLTWVAAWGIVAFVLNFGVLNPLCTALPDRMRPAHIVRLAAAAAIAAGLVWLWSVFRRPICRGAAAIPSSRRRLLGIVLTVGLAGAYLYPNAVDYTNWARHPRYGMPTFGRMLRRRYRQAVLAGGSPLFAVMENEHRALKVTHYRLNWPAMAAGNATHLVLPAAFTNQHQFFDKTFPEIVADRTLVERTMVGRHQHELYALSLQPLSASTAVTGDGIRVSLANPDPHTPQSVCVLALTGTLASPQVLACRDVDLLPLQTQQLAIATAAVLTEPPRIHVIPRHLWRHAMDGTEARRVHRIDDPLAWDLEAIEFHTARRKAPRDQGHVALSIPTGVAPVLFAARLRLTAEGRGEGSGDGVELQWRRDDQIRSRRPLDTTGWPADAYRAVAMPLPGTIADGRDSLRVACRGRAGAVVNAVLIADRAMLAATRLPVTAAAER